MSYTFRGYTVPLETKETIDRYVASGCEPGSFVKAVLTNNLKDAVGSADHMNLANLPAIVAYVYNHVPAPCQGSEKAYRDWLAIGGLPGWVAANDEETT